jgi:hypothetical protein
MNGVIRIILRPLCIAALLGAAGCDLFSTRDPEPPDSGGSSFIPATTADIVIQNLKGAIAEKNAVNYLRCFVDTLNSSRSFTFIPTASAAGRYAAAFSSWSLASERAYFSSLVAQTPASGVPLLTVNGAFVVQASDSAVYESEYTLYFPHGISGAPETTRGHVQFVITIDRNSIWGITRWTDNPLGTDASWSELKGRFAN